MPEVPPALPSEADTTTITTTTTTTVPVAEHVTLTPPVTAEPAQPDPPAPVVPPTPVVTPVVKTVVTTTKTSEKSGINTLWIVGAILGLLLILILAAIIILVVNNSGSTNSNTNTQTNPPAAVGATSMTLTAASTGYSQTGDDVTKDNQILRSTVADQSAILVTGAGKFTLSNGTIIKSGDSSSSDNSSFFGLNAAVVAQAGSTINMNDGTITSTGIGANGAYSTGADSTMNLLNMTIDARGDGAHAVMATQGGLITMSHVTMNTTDTHSGAIATDRGSGTITGDNLTVTTSGADSPAIYSTGSISVVNNSQLSATGAEAAVIEGSNIINLADSALSTSIADKWGVMIYQSMSGDATGSVGKFTMSGGQLNVTGSNSPAFYVTNSTGNINLTNVTINVSSGILVKSYSNTRWGTTGANGGNAQITANNQALTGNLIADNLSVLNLMLKSSSTLTGAINPEKSAKSAALYLDVTSKWIVTAESHVTVLTGVVFSGTNVSNITGNGNNVYYKTSANTDLNGKIYTLVNGGQLIPE